MQLSLQRMNKNLLISFMLIGVQTFNPLAAREISDAKIAVGVLGCAAAGAAATVFAQQYFIPKLNEHMHVESKKKPPCNAELKQDDIKQRNIGSLLQEVPDHVNEIETGPEDAGYKNELLTAIAQMVVQDGKTFRLNTGTLEQAVQRKLEEKINPFKIAEELYFASDFATARNYYERLLPSVIASEPVMRRAHLNYGESLLGVGDYLNGFRELDHRLELRDPLSKPLRHPADIIGSTLLINAEQGLGDTFFFSSLLPALKKLGVKKIILKTQRPLKELMSNCPGVDQAIKAGDPVPEYDYDLYLMSLPRYISQKDGQIALGTVETPDTLPIEQEPYIIPDQGLTEMYTEQFSHDKNIKIGIWWRASKLPGGQARYIQRDIPLADLIGALPQEGITLFSLQGGGHRPVTRGQYDELKAAGQLGEIDELDIVPDDAPPIYEVNDTHGPFMDSAAVGSLLDCGAGVDTSTAHLLGALRRPTFTLLTKAADWRWLTDRNDSPWQPTMTLIRQNEDGSWQPVLKELGERIKELQQRKIEFTSQRA